MNLLEFNLADISSVISVLLGFVKENLILFILIFFSYAIFFVYNFLNNKSVDGEIYESDVLGSAVSSIMTALLLVGLDEGTKGLDALKFDLGSTTTKIAIFLLIYGVFLMICAFVKILPKFLVIVFGNSELDMFINLIAIILTDPKIEITGTMLVVLAVPLTVLFAVQRIRRMMG